MSDSVPFTPGPWRVGDDEDVVTVAAPEWVLAHAPDFWDYDNGEKTFERDPDAPSEGECSANARLIAKAPEMFELLREFVDLLATLNTRGDRSTQRRLGSAEVRAGQLLAEVSA